MGLVLLIVGGMLFINGVLLLLNSEATLSCNGVVTNSWACKMQLTSFSGIFLLLGVVVFFSPKRWINHYIIWQESMPNPFKRRKK